MSTLQHHTARVSERAARLALDEAISNLRSSVHPKGCEEGKQGDDADGEALTERIRQHMHEIGSAIDYHTAALAFYNSSQCR